MQAQGNRIDLGACARTSPSARHRHHQVGPAAADPDWGAARHVLRCLSRFGRRQIVIETRRPTRFEVLARRMFRCRAWDLGVALDWARERAAAKGWSAVTVACEPTGHRWRVLGPCRR